jgi:predicted alpha-1,2-mannosidase
MSVYAQHLTQYVNPFIGTSGGGNTFPGAVRPWGMASVSPHTSLTAPSGYVYDSKQFYGFGHNHLSGTGCAELGSIVVTATRGPLAISPERYRSTLADEAAEPGYYRARLHEPSLHVEATATDRCGLMRWTSTTSGPMHVLFDVGRSLGIVGGGSVSIVAADEVEGYNISGGFCGEANRQTVYFVARLSKGSVERGVWRDDLATDGRAITARDTSIGAWLRVDLAQGESLSIKVGLSYVSVHNARQNLEKELPGWDFERVRTEARQAWEEQLSRIEVHDPSAENKTKFYTALYHMLIHPTVISDVNGEYPLMGRTGIGRYDGRDRYSVFSLWDTYRTLHPFLTLVYPERQSAMMQSMIDMFREWGWLPKWELISNETYMMVGDPAPIVIADSYLKGIRDIDAETAFDAMVKPSLLATPEVLPARPGQLDHLRIGFIPIDQDTTQEWWAWGPVSTSLEYALADWSIAQMASALRKDTLAAEFERRSLFYRNVFDTMSRFMRPRLANGSWLDPFDPSATEGSGDWAGAGGPGYVEGNAWSYTWFVPHDVEGLVSLFSGTVPFTEKLEECFRDAHFTITNEPDIAYPYLFTYVRGKEHRTQELVAEILRKEFGTGPDGLPGNDDCGTISAWLAFSALGFYPACPAADEYRLGVPLFLRTRIKLDERYYTGGGVVIEQRKEGETPLPRGTILFNDEALGGFWIRHSDLVRGGTLVFVVQ